MVFGIELEFRLRSRIPVFGDGVDGLRDRRVMLRCRMTSLLLFFVRDASFLGKLSDYETGSAQALSSGYES